MMKIILGSNMNLGYVLDRGVCYNDYDVIVNC